MSTRLDGGQQRLSFAVRDAHQMTWCCIQELCIHSGERQYRPVCPTRRSDGGGVLSCVRGSTNAVANEKCGVCGFPRPPSLSRIDPKDFARIMDRVS
jgi:hypothetical protein